MVRFLRTYVGNETDGVKYTTGDEAGFLLWQEVQLEKKGYAEIIKPKKKRKPKSS